MCLKQMLETASKTKSPRSPWRRSLREPMKPKLSRRIVASARVNLNRYWNKFEEVSSHKAPLVTCDLPSMYSTYQDNEINENLVNELMELCNK